MTTLTPQDIDRFWSKVEKLGTEGGCWLWTGSCGIKGYGQFYLNRTMRLAHRVSYTLNIAPIPAGLFVCHSCDQRLCVNPAHLWVGTNLDNMRDCCAKGRIASGDRSFARLHPERLSRGAAHAASRRGELNGSAKLTAANVIEIRERYASGGIYQAQLAREFEVDKTLISLVIKRKTWAHIP